MTPEGAVVGRPASTVRAGEERHVAARLVSASGAPVTVMGSVGGAQPDRQELTIKGSKISRRISDFYRDAASSGCAFEQIHAEYDDPRSVSLKAQLDDLALLMAGKPNRLATLEEALRIQVLVENILVGSE